MPLFYFDTQDGQATMEDLYGIELSSQHDAYKVAVDTLPDLARNALPTRAPSVGVTVRDEDGDVVLEVSLVLVVRWVSDNHTRERRVVTGKVAAG